MAAGPITNQKENAFIYTGNTISGGFLALNVISPINKGRPIDTTNTKLIIDRRIKLFFLNVLKSLYAIVLSYKFSSLEKTESIAKLTFPLTYFNICLNKNHREKDI